MTHFIQRFVTVLLALVILTPNISFALTKEQPSETVQSTEQTSETTTTAPSKESAPAEKKETVEQAPEEKETSEKAQALAASSASSPGGSAPGNVQSSAVNVEPFMGSANLSIPIAVPPGRAGIQPNLAVSYSSSGREFGLAGVGWNLDLGSIQRSTKKGVPTYNDSIDTFVMMQGSPQELVKDTASGRYLMEIEGAFARIERVTNFWVLTDKKGVKYTFGNTEGTRLSVPSNPTQIFSWALSLVEDLNGNRMEVSYYKDGSNLYPYVISYNFNSVQVAKSQVTFVYDTIDAASLSFRSGFQRNATRLLRDIKVYANATLQSQYHLDYITSIDTNRKLLKSVQQRAADGTGLPPITFDYNQEAYWRFEKVGTVPASLQFYLGEDQDRHSNGVQVADVNADGYPDLVQAMAHCGGDAEIGVYLNNKNNAWVRDSSFAWPSGVFFADHCSNVRFQGPTLFVLNRNTDLGVRIVDVDGDLRPDILQKFFGKDLVLSGASYVLNNKSNPSLYKNVGTGFSVVPITDPTPFRFSNETLTTFTFSGGRNDTLKNESVDEMNGTMADINGDGFADLFTPMNGGKVFNNLKGTNSLQLGWQPPVPSNYTCVDDACSFHTGTTVMVDLNGDGLDDRIAIIADGSLEALYWNTGTGWLKETASNSPWLQIDSNADLRYNAQFVDLNGDGLLDLVSLSASGTMIKHINTGSGWIKSGNWQFVPNFTFALTGSRFLDANADGLIDFLFDDVTNSKLWQNKMKGPSDLLIGINNGIGATTTINYDSSAKYPSIFMPFVTQVVKSTTVSDAFSGNSYTTNYSYANGQWDPQYREFQGFGMVKVIDADGNYSTSTFAQDHWLKGRPLEQASYDVNGNIYAKTINQWQIQDLLTNTSTQQTSKFVYLQRTDNFSYDGTSPPGIATTHQVFLANTQWDTTQKKFGSASIQFNGTNSYVALPLSNDWNFASEDFTIDFWVRPSGGTSYGLYSHMMSGGGSLQINYDAGALQLNAYNGATTILDLRGNTSLASNTWAHIAAVRQGNTFYIFKDGALLNSTTAAIAMPIINEGFTLGRGNVNGTFKYFLGDMDEFRISKGMARWKAPFIPPLDDYSTTCDGMTKLLLHFDGAPESGACVSSGVHKRTAQEFTYGETPQYGDPTQVINYGEVDFVTGADVKSDRISSQMQYVYNPSKWLLGLPKYTLARDFDSNLISQTWFNYDGSTDNNAIPTKGQLTSKTSWLGDPTQVDPVTQYSYDDYGNLETTTDPLGRMTTITYDTDVHMFPVTVTNALNQSVTTRYYGVQSVLAVGGQWGQTHSTTDANAQTVRFFYDIFGRPTSTVGPLDSVAKPSSTTSYEQMPTYTKITSKARVESGVDATIDSVSYYDGLGRLIESKSLGPNPGQYIVGGQTEYNNRGLAVKQYLPRFTSTNLNTIDPIDTSVPFSRTEYDPMGRAIKTVSTDGTYANVVYDHWMTTIYDENGHKQRSISDAYGRLIQKEEYKGADGRATDYPATPYTLYATTRYGYDPAGNLTSVIDTKGNMTRIQYDHLNRKIGMDDPDMGIWSYGYDANGNLIWQRDAKGQTVRFSYDKLNRLLNKTDGIPTGPINNFPTIPPVSPSFNVAYRYDVTSQAYGKGRLGDVAYDSGTAGFTYDLLGREIASTKRIDATMYSVSRQYDALNRLKQLQYPDGAQVDYRYNQAGQVVSVADVGAAGVISTQLAKVPGLLGVPEAYAQTASPNSSSYLGVYLMPSCYSTCTIGGTITFTASVTSYGATINRVEFYNGTAMVASDTTSPYTYTIPNASPGTYQVSAKVYTATASASSSSLSIVIPGTTTNHDYPRGSIQMTSPTSSAVFAPGANIPLKATVISSSTNVVQVMFYNDSRLLGVATPGSGNTYSFNWSTTTLGSHPVTPKMLLAGGVIVPGATQLVTVRTPDPLPDQRYITQVDYNAFGQITQIQYGNGITTAYTYELLSKRLKRIYTTNAQADRIQDLTYRYDAAGQIMAISDALNTATQNFKYDELNRLVWAQGSYGTKTYVYDEIGNIIQKDGLIYAYGEDNCSRPH